MGFSAKAVSKDACLCQAPPVLHATASLLDSTPSASFLRISDSSFSHFAASPLCRRCSSIR
jgi:hypothetical protein